MTSPTALILQIATADRNSRQQVVALPSGVVFRRSVMTGSRTQWRYAMPDAMPTWLGQYVLLAKGSSPAPMDVVSGCALMEVTPAEVSEMETSTFPRNVGLRYQRVLDAMEEAPGEWPVTDADHITEWVERWVQAVRDGDEKAVTRSVHPAGKAATKTTTATKTTPEPAPKSEPADPFAHQYPETVGGFITRPNGHKYRVRMIEGREDVALLRKARVHGDHVFMTGDPGTGKTALAEAAFGSNLVTMIGTEDTETSDFVGSYVPTGKPGKYRWQDGGMIDAMERGVPYFVDECGVISPKVMTVVYSVMDGRGEYRVTDNPKRGVVTAQPGFFVVLATNPHAPGVRISEALTSRVGLTIEVGTDFKMMRTLGVPDDAVTVAENLNTRRTSGDEGLWVPQARELLRYKEQVDRYGTEVAVRNLIASAPEDAREVVVEVVQRVYGGAKRTMLTL